MFKRENEDMPHNRIVFTITLGELAEVPGSFFRSSKLKFGTSVGAVIW